MLKRVGYQIAQHLAQALWIGQQSGQMRARRLTRHIQHQSDAGLVGLVSKRVPHIGQELGTRSTANPG